MSSWTPTRKDVRRARHLPLRRIALLTAGLALAGCATTVPEVATPISALPQAAITPATVQNQRTALAELGRLLAGFRMPPGAEQVTAAPVAMLDRAPLSESSPNLLTSGSLWRIDETYAGTIAWVFAHAPAGLTSTQSGFSGGAGIPENRVLGFSAPDTTAYDGAQLTIEVVAIGESSGIRVDAQVVWLPAKPAAETVPLGTPVILVVKDGVGFAGDPVSKGSVLHAEVLDRADGGALLTDLDALRPDDGEVRHCAADFGERVFIEVVVAGVAEVYVAGDPCNLVPVTRGGVSLPTLSSTSQFAVAIDHLTESPRSP